MRWGGSSSPPTACLPVCLPEPTIESVEEPSTCKYVMRACVPSLCVADSPPQPPAEPRDAGDASDVGAGARPPFVGLLWGAVLDGGNEVARELLAPAHYATGASSIRFA